MMGARTVIVYLYSLGLVTCVTYPPLRFDLLHDLGEVIALRVLHWRVWPVGFKFLQPQDLAKGNDVPVVEIRGDWPGECAALTEEGLHFVTDGALEGITL